MQNDVTTLHNRMPEDDKYYKRNNELSNKGKWKLDLNIRCQYLAKTKIKNTHYFPLYHINVL